MNILYFTLGVLGAFLIAFYIIVRPVEKNRYLYGNNPLQMILCVMIFIATTFFLLYGGIVTFSDVDASEVLSKDYTPTSDKSDTGHVGSRQQHEMAWAILSQFSDPGNLPAANSRGRWIAVVSALLGIICLSGFLVSSIVNFLSRKADKWKKGLIHYRWWHKRYVVIIGVNEQTATIVKSSLSRKDVDYVLIQTRQDVDKARMQVGLSLDEALENKIVYYFAERTSREDIEALRLEKATELYILGERMDEPNEEDHDAFNIDCLQHVSHYLDNVYAKERKKGRHRKDFERLRCHVNFEYQSTFTAFKSSHIYQVLDRTIEFLPFNIHEIWSKKVLVDNFAIVPSGKKGEMTVQRYRPIDGGGIGLDGESSRRRVHLVIVGMNQMGTAFGMQAALLAHFPNFSRDKSRITTITFIDDHAKEEGDYLRGRFGALFDLCPFRTVICGKDELLYDPEGKSFNDPMKNGPYAHLGENFMDIRWEFIAGSIASDEVKKYLVDVSSDKDNITTVAICFNHPKQSVAAALYLPSAIFHNSLQVLVYEQNSFDLIQSVADTGKDWQHYENLLPFGMIESSYNGDVMDNMAVKLQNFMYKNRGNAEVLNALKSFEYSLIGDIERRWEELTFIDKQSNVDLVDSIPFKLRSLGIDYKGNPAEIEARLEEGGSPLLSAMADAEHRRWLTERMTMGFRPYRAEEMDSYNACDENSKARLKSEYKLIRRAHLDICSGEDLVRLDSSTGENERRILTSLPFTIRCTEWLNIMRLRITSRQNSSSASILTREFFRARNEEHTILHVPAGCMNVTVKDNDKEKNKDVVCKDSLWMADNPVTRWQWYVVTGKDRPRDKDRNMPVVNVSKNEIEDFLTILRRRTGLYFDLPSLSEWEYAARKSTPYLDHSQKASWGKYICFKAKHANAAGRYQRRQRNPLGIYNMLGNVWEWTREEYANPNRDKCFYLCGGSWRFKVLECDLYDDYWCSYRGPESKSDDLGFRLIWKFSVSEQDARNIASCDYRSENEDDVKESVENWFKNHKMMPVGEGYFIQGTETADTNEGLKADGNAIPESWLCNVAEIDETPHHFVRIKSILMCQTTVTQELWNLVMGVAQKSNPSAVIGDDYPQTNVSYREIIDEFLPRLEKITGRKYRLPTESEWEYAAKEGNKSDISECLSEVLERKDMTAEGKWREIYRRFSDRKPYYLYSGSDSPEEVAWINCNSPQKVGRKKPNRLGLYDMSGNVWEWCDDFYQSDYYVACTDETTDYSKDGYVVDTKCRDKGYSGHVFRGGSWKLGEVDCRCTRPNYWLESYGDDDLGFRLVQDE